MADKRVLEEQQCNTTTPRGARQLKRRRIVNSSPLSDTARRLLLHKCSDSGHGSRESAVSTMVVEPVSSPTAVASTSDACISSSQASSAPERSSSLAAWAIASTAFGGRIRALQ